MLKRTRKTSKLVRGIPKVQKRIGNKPSAKTSPVRGSESNAGNGDDKIQKYNPSHRTRFAKGDGRKRPGRPRGSKNLRTVIMEAVNDPVIVIIEGKQRKITKLQATAMQLATKAASGNDKAIAKLLDWVDEIEARAMSDRPAEYPFNDADAKVIKEIYERLRSYDERANG